MILQTNVEGENQLKGLGLDFPSYPKQGEIKYKENVVGYADNFNGLKISENAEEVTNLLLANEGNLTGVIFWNKP